MNEAERQKIILKIASVMTPGELQLILILDSSQSFTFNDGSKLSIDKLTGQRKFRILFKEDGDEPWSPVEYIFDPTDFGLE